MIENLDKLFLRWRRHSFRSLSSYESFESSYIQALEHVDPREPDPVYVTLREAARKRSSSTGIKTKTKKMPARRRCFSENLHHTNKMNGTTLQF